MHTGILLLMVYSSILTVFLIGVFKFDIFERQWFSKYFGSHLLVVLRFAFSFIVVVPLLYVGLLFLDIASRENIGQVGDFIGGILNPLLSFMALIAVLVSIKTQENAQEKQERLLSQQLFEASLFNLMEMLRVRRAEISKINIKGIDTEFFPYMRDMFRKKRIEIDAKNLKEEDAVKEAMDYLQQTANYQGFQVLRAQFRLVVDFVEGASLDFEQKTKYYRIFLSDFSQPEITCMANNFFRYEFFKEILRKHGLIKTKDAFLLSAQIKIFYSDNIYMKKRSS